MPRQPIELPFTVGDSQEQFKVWEGSLNFGAGVPVVPVRGMFGCRLSARTAMMSTAVDADGKQVKFIELDLYGTQVGPVGGGQPESSDTFKGFFTDQVTVLIAPAGGGIACLWDEPHAAPENVVQTYSIGFNASASGGVMANTPLLSAGLGFSVNNSVTIQFPCWDVKNTTFGANVTHLYYLRSVGNRPYDIGDPGSGVFPPGSDKKDEPLVQIGALIGGGLVDPPAISTSNLPIASHAVWRTEEGGSRLNDTINLDVQIKARFVAVGRHKALIDLYARNVVEQWWDFGISVPLGKIGN